MVFMILLMLSIMMNEMDHVPQLLGTFGVSTISGIAYNVNWEMIILGIN